MCFGRELVIFTNVSHDRLDYSTWTGWKKICNFKLNENAAVIWKLDPEMLALMFASDSSTVKLTLGFLLNPIEFEGFNKTGGGSGVPFAE